MATDDLSESHGTEAVATDDLWKSHGTEAGLKRAQLEIQQKFEQEKRKLEQQTARFAKRQALTNA